MKLWYADIDDFSDAFYRRSRALLPGHMLLEIDRYHAENDRKSKLLARLLVRHYCLQNSCKDWSAWKKEQNHKPYLEQGPFFNISHAGSKVVVVFSETHPVGADIEQVIPVDVPAFSGFLHPDEVSFLQLEEDPATTFFAVWTRKEALLKAIGTGLMGGLDQVSVLGDQPRYKGQWFLKEYALFDKYKTCICSSSPLGEVSIQHIDKSQLNRFIDEKILL